MSNKGKKFTRADLPRLTQQRIKNKQVSEEELEQLEAWLSAQTERNRVVAYDGDTPLIAEEVAERSMRHHSANETGEIDGDVLSAVRGLMTLTVDQRAQVLNAFDMDAELVNPFRPVAEQKPTKKAAKK